MNAINEIDAVMTAYPWLAFALKCLGGALAGYIVHAVADWLVRRAAQHGARYGLAERHRTAASGSSTMRGRKASTRRNCHSRFNLRKRAADRRADRERGPRPMYVSERNAPCRWSRMIIQAAR